MLVGVTEPSHCGSIADTKVCLICRKNCGFKTYKHIICSFESASMISETIPPSFSAKDTISVLRLCPSPLFILQCQTCPSFHHYPSVQSDMQLLLCLPRYPPNDSPLPPKTNLPSFSFASAPNVTFPSPPPQAVNPPTTPPPHSAPASLPARCSLSKRHFPPPFQSSTPILPLVSLMNGFTAGKVLIFIPLSDFCWLLLISNTQRKATESINKEMNTLHPAMHTAVHPGCGPSEKASSAFILIEFSVTFKSSVLLFFLFFFQREEVVWYCCIISNAQTKRTRETQGGTK